VLDLHFGGTSTLEAAEALAGSAPFCINPDCVRLRRENGKLRKRVEALGGENAELRQKLVEAERHKKRQTAPFSKGEPKKNPKRPGRKPGKNYGPKAHRPIPDHVDEIVAVRLPSCCPHCGDGSVAYDKTLSQHQEEIPKVKAFVRRFDVDFGHCEHCGKPVHSRHPLQTSDAFGAAGIHLGPEARAQGAYLNKEIGIPFGKVRAIFWQLFSLKISRGGLSQNLDRVADHLLPTYDACVEHLQRSPVVSADETGWKVAGQLAWLWAFVTPELTVYRIMDGRSYEDACTVLRAEFCGNLLRDGWAPYRSYVHATHQTCIGGHLIRRCKELLDTAQRGTARVPHAVLRVLYRSLALRDHWIEHPPSDRGRAIHAGIIAAAMDRVLAWRPVDDENRKLLKHLRNERGALFTFLLDPAVPASNFWGEQAMRPAVVTRKVWGGNRTPSGAVTQSVLASCLRSCHQQHVDPGPIIVEVLRSPVPMVARLPCFTSGPTAARPPTS
jgi:transposase